MSRNLENTYAALPEIFFRKQMPEAAPAPHAVVFNEELAKGLGLGDVKDAAEIFSGAKLPPGSVPISQAYAGHQFGYFTMLGDGRAVLLGEQIAPSGERFDIQLKGSGRTPFSRRGDGYAALLPMLREYIVGEAMFALGIPTTRGLAVVLTGREVVREEVLQGAVLTRVASSHIRVGTFDYISEFGTPDDLRILADYTIRRHFARLENAADKYVLFLREVARRQADLIAKWQLVGFIHGVMNTDNMAISGETIDYGPCAFMDAYDPDTVFSSIDTHGRYAYKNQPKIGAWNLARFAEALLPLLDADEEKAAVLARREIEFYWDCFNQNWLSGMRAKLGITGENPDDADRINDFLEEMAAKKSDFTNTFRAQAKGDAKKYNPAVIPRNHRVEEALSAADEGDFSVMHELLAALRNPFEDSEKYSQPPPTCCGYQTFCGT
ncbi:MAG: YdiU family protein [Defluviitaleaceae bacterium]|nr:YdiU family protein [Defluviitaleaceae bacterium]